LSVTWFTLRSSVAPEDDRKYRARLERGRSSRCDPRSPCSRAGTRPAGCCAYCDPRSPRSSRQQAIPEYTYTTTWLRSSVAPESDRQCAADRLDREHRGVAIPSVAPEGQPPVGSGPARSSRPTCCDPRPPRRATARHRRRVVLRAHKSVAIHGRPRGRPPVRTPHHATEVAGVVAILGRPGGRPPAPRRGGR
jgi:hypothetical protein